MKNMNIQNNVKGVIISMYYTAVIISMYYTPS